MAKNFLEKLNMKPKEIVIPKPKPQETKVKKNSIQVKAYNFYFSNFFSHTFNFTFSS
jgi:hypothetical protein